MAHHPTFRKIYCDAVPYLFKKVRHTPGHVPLGRRAIPGLRTLALPGMSLSFPVSFPGLQQVRPPSPWLPQGRPSDAPTAPFL